MILNILTGVSGPLAATLTYDTLRFGEFEDFPETTEPVWILGNEYSALTGLKLKHTHEHTHTQYNHISLFMIFL